MAEALLPVRTEPLFTEREHVRAEVREVPAGQDAKAALVHDELEAVVLVGVRPADPAIPRARTSRLRRKRREGLPTLPAMKRRTRGSRRSSAGHQGSGAPPSTPYTALLQTAQRASLELPARARDVPPPMESTVNLPHREEIFHTYLQPCDILGILGENINTVMV